MSCILVSDISYFPLICYSESCNLRSNSAVVISTLLNTLV